MRRTLQHLCREGHKASLSKLQFVQQKVTFLGHVLTPNGKSLSPERISAIVNTLKPLTKKQAMSFLAMCSYCRHFIPNFSVLERPLRDATHARGLTASSKFTWTPEAETSFVNLKKALQSAPTLGVPNPDKPFVQHVDEKEGCMTSVLLQKHGSQLKPVAFFSCTLDPVAKALPHCLRAVAAAERAVLASRDFVGFSESTLLVPHAVSALLSEQKTSHLSAARWLRYHFLTCHMSQSKDVLS